MYRIVIVIFLLLAAVPVKAQETFLEPETGLQLEHPSDWTASSENQIITLEADALTMMIYAPAALAAMIDADLTTLSTGETADEFLNAMDYTAGESRVRRSAQGTRVYVDFTSADMSGELIAVPVADLVVIVVLSGEDVDSSDEEIQSLIGSFEFVEMETAEPEAVALPTELTQFNAIWSDAVAELQDLGLVGSGGSLIFRENRAFFTGQGSWFMPLASQAPRTDIVMAGQLTFTPSGATGLLDTEYCSLTARIIVSNNLADKYLEVGMDSDGYVYYFDRFGDDLLAIHQDFIQIEDFELTAPHHFLMLALDDRLSLYVDGQLIFADREIDEHAGSYGVGLVGEGPTAACVATDIWAYESPTFQPGVCEITASGSVNKRTGPGTNFDQAGQLVSGAPARAQAQTTAADGFIWWQLDDDNWVRSDIVTAQGDCKAIPVIES